VVNPESPSIADLNKALAEVAQAAKSIRALFDYLERHPESLIQGKGSSRK
jgi:paraquat-inducible protein B